MSSIIFPRSFTLLHYEHFWFQKRPLKINSKNCIVFSFPSNFCHIWWYFSRVAAQLAHSLLWKTSNTAKKNFFKKNEEKSSSHYYYLNGRFWNQKCSQWCIDRKHQKAERERLYHLMPHEGPLLLQVSNILLLFKSLISQISVKNCVRQME